MSKTMKDRVEEHGGLFLCSYQAKNGRAGRSIAVRAKDAEEARHRLTKVVGCALTLFTVNAFVC